LELSSTTIPKTGYVYLIKNSEGYYKIGFSKDPHKRIKQLQTANPYKLKLIHCIKCINRKPRDVEKRLHKMFNLSNIKREWFSFSEDYVKFFSTFKSDIDIYGC
jgi:hypothetical protein